MKQGQVLLLALLFMFLTGCTTMPPKDQDNLCSIYREYPDWYEDSLEMQSEFGTPTISTWLITRGVGAITVTPIAVNPG